MAFQYITTTEPITAYGNAKFPDTKNRNGKLLVSAFLQEHDITGIHTLPLLQVHQDSYVGTNTAQTISLANTLANIKILFIFSASYPGVYLVSNISTTYAVKSSQLSDVYTDFACVLSQGAFDLTATSGDELNANGVTYYYAALCTGAVDDSGDNSDPPTWVEHGDDLKGGAGFAGNQVEEKLYSYFTVGHNDNGTHKSAAFTGKSIIETGSFVCDGTALQEIPLAQPALNIKAFFVWHPTMQQPIYLQTATMAKLRGLTATILPDTGYVTLAKGEFHIDGTKLEAESQLLGIYSDTYDGDPNIVDSSEYQHTITKQVIPDSLLGSLIAHSTDYPHTGATSIKWNMGGNGHIGILYKNMLFKQINTNNVTAWNFTFDMRTTDILSLISILYFSNASQQILMYFGMNYQGFLTIQTTNIQLYYQAEIINYTLNDGNWHSIEIGKNSNTNHINIFIDMVEVAWFIASESFYLGYFIFNLQTSTQSAMTAYLDDIEMFATNPVFIKGETYYYAAIGEYSP